MSLINADGVNVVTFNTEMYPGDISVYINVPGIYRNVPGNSRSRLKLNEVVEIKLNI